MNGILSQKRLRWVSLGLVLGALAAPQAQARTNAPGDRISNPRAVTTFRNDDRLGPKYVPVADGGPVRHTASAITIVKPAGFDVGDALIGAGAAAVATALLAALFLLSGPRKRRRSTSGVAVRIGPRA